MQLRFRWTDDADRGFRAFWLESEEYRGLYSAIGVSEYDPMDPGNNYSVSRPNAYTMKLICSDHNDKWIMGEDEQAPARVQIPAVCGARAWADAPEYSGGFKSPSWS